MNVAQSRPNSIDEERAVRLGQIDRSVPVVPAIEVTLAMPVEVAPALLRPAPCEKPLAFLGRLVQEASIADSAFGERWNAATPFAGPNDEVMDLHADLNAAGKLLYTALHYALGSEDLPAYRYLLNRIDNAWLDFNAHAGKVAPGIELAQARALQDQIAGIAASMAGLPVTSPDWSSPEFAGTCKMMLLGARLTRKEVPLSFTFAAVPVAVVFGAGLPSIAPCEAACTAASQLCSASIHRLESLGDFATIPDDQRKLREAIRAKFPALPTASPRFYIAHHYQIASTNKRLVPLEEGREEDAILDRTLQPGEALFVSIKSWAGDPAGVAQAAAYPDTPLPEARDDLMRRLRAACNEGVEESGLAGRTILAPTGLAGGILQLLKELILAQARDANTYRTFTMKTIPPSRRKACRKGGLPTDPRKENLLHFENGGEIPLRVRYIPAQKTYTITISFARATLLCNDGASWKEAGREKWPRALAAMLKPDTPINETPVPAAIREAEAQGMAGAGPLAFDVVLRQPIAATFKFIKTHVKNFTPGARRDNMSGKRAGARGDAKKDSKKRRAPLDW